MSIFINKAKYVLINSWKTGLQVLSDVDILIEDGVVKCIDKTCSKPRDATVINGVDKVITPAFINPYLDFNAHILINNSIDINETTMINILDDLGDIELCRKIVRYTCILQVLSGFKGFTTISEKPDIVNEECREFKLKTWIGKWINGEPPSSPPARGVIGLKISSSSIEDITKYREYVYSGDCKLFIKLDGSLDQVFDIKRKTGKWFIEYLYINDLLNSNVALVDLNWISNMELGYLAERKPLIIVYPSHTMIYGFRGFTPLHEIIDRNIPLAIGVDGVFNPRFNPWLELSNMYLLYRHLYGDQRVSLDKLYSHMLTSTYMFFEGREPLIVVDKPFDLAIYPIHLNTIVNPLHYLYMHRPHPSYLIINGYIVVNPRIRLKMLFKLRSLSIEIREAINQLIDRFK